MEEQQAQSAGVPTVQKFVHSLNFASARTLPAPAKLGEFHLEESE
jgi:hypothetical protein